VIRLVAAGSLVLLVVPGCTGGSDAPTSYTGPDSERVAHVEPETPGMEWPANGILTTYSPEDAGPPPKIDNPALAQFLEQTDALEYVGDASGRWETDDNVANPVVEVWATEDDAAAAMGPHRAFSRAIAEQTGAVGVDEDVDDLGDEAWRVGDLTRLSYTWRRANMIIDAHIGCLACPLGLDEVLREWVDAIDEEARSGE
jgi:hypothetical protein